jgi:hypothetical protein
MTWIKNKLTALQVTVAYQYLASIGMVSAQELHAQIDYLFGINS